MSRKDEDYIKREEVPSETTGREEEEQNPQVAEEATAAYRQWLSEVRMRRALEGAAASSCQYGDPRTEEAMLADAIDSKLRQVEEVRQKTHADDEEIARLGAETRGLIDEMLRDLNLKAA